VRGLRDPKKERVSEKRVAIDEFSKGFWTVVKKASDEIWAGAGKMWADTSEFQTAVQAQVKENEEAVTKIGEEIKKLSSDIHRYARDFW